MKIVLLSPYPDPLLKAFARTGDNVVVHDAGLDSKALLDACPDFVVAYGYRHILRQPLMSILGQRLLNLHISYLPWNRGAHPNFWSIAEGTPSGVTIHVIDEGIDTGPIVAQRRVDWHMDDSFASSYARLRGALEELFVDSWSDIRSGKLEALPQRAGGTSHRRKDLQAIDPRLLPQGWDTPVRLFLALRDRHADAVRTAFDANG